MMMNTHILLAKSLLDNMDSDKGKLISEKNFIYGNIKPDAVSKYKFRKHYLNESYEMIRDKIVYLSRMNLDEIEKKYTRASFSQELGVCCHFLADFFCVAHSERWEFKSNMYIHIKYEKGLTKLAKEYRFKNEKALITEDFDSFFSKIYNEYKRNGNFESNDLLYSTYVCNTVTSFVLDRIIKRGA